MRYLRLPPGQHRLTFYLAAEEWCARECEGDIFFQWQVEPTVIVGRNQIVDIEVDLPYCRRNSIDVCRRKSGGGCVFADRNNIMFSYITDCPDSVATTFSGYTSGVAAMLRSLGLDSRSTSRNDVVIGDRKVSGNAFWHIPETGRCIVHGTMLYSTDFTHMSHAITPSRSKLLSKGVTSTASRITTIREHLPEMSLDRFRKYARDFLCGTEELTPDAAGITAIEEIERELTADSWIYRKTHSSSLSRSKRVEGCGDITADIDLREGVIEQVTLSGDFFTLADPDETLLTSLRGVRYSREAIDRALSDTDVSRSIAALSTESFINILI